jgi:hypothetical protein
MTKTDITPLCRGPVLVGLARNGAGFDIALGAEVL